METGFEWTHESGLVIRRLPADTARGLYAGHEVAGHTLTRPRLETLDKAALLRELGEDRDALRRLLGRRILGFAVPFDYSDGLSAD